MPSPSPSVRRVLRHTLALLLVWSLVLPVASGEDMSPEKQLQAGRREEYVEGNYNEAIKHYRAVSRNDLASETLKGKAVMGLARCHTHLGQDTAARDNWTAVLGLTSITENERKIAEDELAKLSNSIDQAASNQQSDEARKEALEDYRKERRAEATDLLRRARSAFASKDYEAARRLAHRSSSLVGKEDRKEQDALLAEIAQVLPDRAALIRNLVEFFQTAQIEQYRGLQEEAKNLYDAGKRALKRESWREADRLFRRGIEAIDESGLLGSAAVIAGNPLAMSRNRLKEWLRVTHDRAKSEADLSFPPIPREPDPRSDSPGFASQFYGLIAEAFGSRSGQEEPLRFYDLSGTAGESRVTSSGKFEEGSGVSTASEAGDLGRARWLERWMLREFPGAWPRRSSSGLPSPRARRPVRPNATRMPPVRFGDWLVVQHGESMHGRIDAQSARFPKDTPELVISMHVMATTTTGVVQACEALTARARRAETAHAIALPRTTLKESLALLESIDGGNVLTKLGSVTMQLDGGPSASVRMTALTEAHPQYIGLSAPPLRVSAEDARYGLYFTTYVEPLRPEKGSGDTAAFSVVARVRTPQGSVNVPFRAGDLRFTRIPRMAEQTLEADLELALGGSFMLLGMQNPFSATTPGQDQLVVLMGIHPKGTTNPDPPRTPSRILPADTRHAEFDMGPLGTEFLDHDVGMGWPQRSPASMGVLEAQLEEVRDQYLAQLISTGSGLSDPTRPPEAWPVTVQRGRVTGVLSPQETQQVMGFLEKLHAHENDLYDIQVVSAVVTREQAETWTSEDGLTKDKDDWWILDTAASARIDARLREAATPDSLFALDERVPARATQRIGITSLRAKTVVRDFDVHPTPRGAPRYTPVLGMVEQGLIVEIRPGLTIEPGALRPVSVGIRAARVQGLERMAYPGAKVDEAEIVMPTWHPTVDVLGAPPLTDAQAALIQIPYPGDPANRILVKIRVRKVR